MGDLNVAVEAVLVDSSDMPPEITTEVRGYDFNAPVDFEKLMTTYYSTGFQATSLANAISVVNEMVSRAQLSNNTTVFDIVLPFCFVDNLQVYARAT